MSANIHSPISGTVTAVDAVPNGQGLRQVMITIKREGDEWAEGIDRSETLVRECALSSAEIIARIKDAGIVGMGGATFPTHVKLSGSSRKKGRSLDYQRRGVRALPDLRPPYDARTRRGTARGRDDPDEGDRRGEGLHRHRKQQTRRHSAPAQTGRMV